MNHHHGFSFIDVLLALMLTSTTTCYLFFSQLEALSLAKKLFNQAEAIIFLDNIDENLLYNNSVQIQLKEPYIVDIHREDKEIDIFLSWPKNSLARHHDV